MKSNLFKFYRIPVILSISLAVVLISQVFKGSTFNLILLVLGCLLGTFFLDLDYFLHTYILEPHDHFSGLLKDYIRSKDISGAFNYILFHSDEVENKTLNSALFQISMIFFSIFLVRSDVSIFFKALVISIQLNSVFRFLYFYFQGHGNEWFWILKKTPGVFFIVVYNFVIISTIGLAIYLFK